jgi:hypothetical protein
MSFLPKKFVTFLAFLSLAIAATSVSAATKDKDYGALHPFSTDGCTDFPNGTPDKPNLWLACCIHHDLLYWAGGSIEQKLKADEYLFKCVAEKHEPVIAALMFAGVTVGGTPWIKDPARWGYGWPKLRGFHHLSDEELEQVKQLSPQNLDQLIEQLSN